MKKQFALFVLGSSLALGAAFASSGTATPGKPAASAAAPAAAAAPNKQQTKMADCNAQAKEKDMKGDERKKFMSSCLSAQKVSQQEKMKTCNKEAGDKKLKGDERKKFMSGCLSA